MTIIKSKEFCSKDLAKKCGSFPNAQEESLDEATGETKEGGLLERFVRF